MTRKQRDNPSVAQILHRHKFVTIGAVESMLIRVDQLINDKMIPSGAFKQDLMRVHNHLHAACQSVRTVEMKFKIKEA